MLAVVNARTLPTFKAISTMREMGAYEWLWQQDGGPRKPSFKAVAQLFRDDPGALPSDLVDEDAAMACAREVLSRFDQRGVRSFSVRMFGVSDYPPTLRDAENPLEFLYYQGAWNLAHAPKRVAIVGTRNPSDDGLRRTRKLVGMLVQNGCTIVSGLAKGVDTAAHDAAITHGGDTIAVLGTPLDHVYPSENAALQQRIARDHLLISQVPVLLYARRSHVWNRQFFPERNLTMSALTHATVIVEAGETSGTLIQARAALSQGRKLFILDSNFRNPKLTWPHKHAEKGAVRVTDFDDIRVHLNGQAPNH